MKKEKRESGIKRTSLKDKDSPRAKKEKKHRIKTPNKIKNKSLKIKQQSSVTKRYTKKNSSESREEKNKNKLELKFIIRSL